MYKEDLKKELKRAVRDDKKFIKKL